MRGAPIEGMSDQATIALAVMILALLCVPLVLPFLMPMPGRGRHRPWRWPRRRVVARPQWFDQMPVIDRASVLYDVEADPLLPWAAPAPRGLHLSDAEIEALAAPVPPLLPQFVVELGGPPIGDQAEAWLRENT